VALYATILAAASYGAGFATAAALTLLGILATRAARPRSRVRAGRS
jgi:hypothetical protein